jgi:uncharacterized protein YfdQ (DUF2303 family)
MTDNMNVDSIVKLAREAVTTTVINGRTFALLPAGMHVQDVTPDKLYPPEGRIEANVRADDQQSMIDYLLRYTRKDARPILYADEPGKKIKAVIDQHKDAHERGAVTHDITLTLTHDVAYLRWIEFAKNWQSQHDFALFLEENMRDVKEPAPGGLLTLAKDIEATSDMAYKGAIRLDNGDREIRMQRETKTNLVVPAQIVLDIPIWFGGANVNIECWLRYRVNDETLKFKIEPHRLAYRVREAFRDVAWAIADQGAVAADKAKTPILTVYGWA